MCTSCNQTGDMRHINQKISTMLVGNFSETGKINHTRISRATSNNQLRLMFGGQCINFIIINQMIVALHTILHGIEPFAGLVWGSAMCQVTTGRQAHSQNGITWLNKCLHDCLIGLRAGIWLNIGVGAVVKFTHPFNCQIFGNIDKLATTIITPTRIPFGIFICHN